MQLSKKQFISLALFIAIAFLFWRSGITKYLSLEAIQKSKDLIHAFVAEHYIFSIISFVLLYMVAVSLSVPAAALSMLGGFLFGFLPGLFTVLLGATLGACLIFVLVRYLFGETLQKKYASQFVNFNNEIHKNGIFYLLSLRLSIVVPFFLVNVLSGLTNMRLITFALITYFGIIPATAMFVYAGQQLQDVTSIQDVFTPSIILTFLALALLSLLPVLLKRKKQPLN